VIFTVPVAAVLAAMSRKDTGVFALTENGEDGFAVTPGGNPTSETWTCPENPFCGVIPTLIAELVFPCTIDTLGAESVNEKSAAGGG